ncbi:MAG: transcription antitermination factor NusB [Chitinophagales bacterium]|nr:transcription antitermination factor NusB [Chitinophagales bacterium]
MLSRRNIRIKVMQTIYAHESGSYNNMVIAEKALLKSIQNAYTLALYNLYIVREVALYARKEAKMRAAKKLPSQEDLNFNTRIAESPLAVALENNTAFNDLIKEHKVHLMESEEVIKSLFKKLIGRPEYKRYLAQLATLESEKGILSVLLNKVMLHDELYTSHVEELFTNWIDDQAPVLFKLNQLLGDVDFEAEISKRESFQPDEEDEEFARELFSKTVSNDEDFGQLIAPKLQNWDLERIASLDMILMKMAICELMFFKNIPIKVSINEYIDISKIYSTPKSKDFINGILDKLMNQLKNEGRIKKQGRGLMGQ